MFNIKGFATIGFVTIFTYVVIASAATYELSKHCKDYAIPKDLPQVEFCELLD